MKKQRNLLLVPSLIQSNKIVHQIHMKSRAQHLTAGPCPPSEDAVCSGQLNSKKSSYQQCQQVDLVAASRKKEQKHCTAESYTGSSM